MDIGEERLFPSPHALASASHATVFVPPPSTPEGTDEELVRRMTDVVASATRDATEFDFSSALREVWSLISDLNKYIVAREPWALAKKEDGRPLLDHLDRFAYTGHALTYSLGSDAPDFIDVRYSRTPAHFVDLREESEREAFTGARYLTVGRGLAWQDAMAVIVWEGIIITVLVLTGFAIGFSRNTDLGWQLVGEWFLINGVLSGLATLVALAHPVTVAATVVAGALVMFALVARPLVANVTCTLPLPVGPPASLQAEAAAAALVRAALAAAVSNAGPCG